MALMARDPFHTSKVGQGKGSLVYGMTRDPWPEELLDTQDNTHNVFLSSCTFGKGQFSAREAPVSKAWHDLTCPDAASTFPYKERASDGAARYAASAWAGSQGGTNSDLDVREPAECVVATPVGR
eukprot:365067-Chlamydomonas_euryale.AAC.10